MEHFGFYQRIAVYTFKCDYWIYWSFQKTEIVLVLGTLGVMFRFNDGFLTGRIPR